MGVDKRGVDRGNCKESHCLCTDFKPGSSHKCSCGHLPTVHMAKTVSQPLPGRTGASPKTSRRVLSSSRPDPTQSWSSVVAGLVENFSSYTISQSQHYGKHHHDNGYYGNHSHTTVRQQYQAVKLCKNGCGRPRYYDDELGEFEYCSGQCRDNHFLPKYEKKLSEALKEGNRQMYCSSESPRPPSGSKQPSPRPPSGPKPSSPHLHHYHKVRY